MPRALYAFITGIYLLQAAFSSSHTGYSRSPFDDELIYLNSAESYVGSKEPVDFKFSGDSSSSSQGRKLRIKRRSNGMNFREAKESNFQLQRQRTPSPFTMKSFFKRKSDFAVEDDFEGDSEEGFVKKRIRPEGEKEVVVSSDVSDKEINIEQSTSDSFRDFPKEFRSESKRIWDAGAIYRAYSKSSPASVQSGGSPFVEEGKVSEGFDGLKRPESRLLQMPTETSPSSESDNGGLKLHRPLVTGIVRSSPHFNLSALSPPPSNPRRPTSASTFSSDDEEDIDDEVAELTNDMEDFGFFVQGDR